MQEAAVRVESCTQVETSRRDVRVELRRLLFNAAPTDVHVSIAHFELKRHLRCGTALLEHRAVQFSLRCAVRLERRDRRVPNGRRGSVIRSTTCRHRPSLAARNAVAWIGATGSATVAAIPIYVPVAPRPRDHGKQRNGEGEAHQGVRSVPEPRPNARTAVDGPGALGHNAVVRASLLVVVLSACGTASLSTEPAKSDGGAAGAPATPASDAASSEANSDSGPGGSGAAPLDAGPPDLSVLPACTARPKLAGACVQILEGTGDFSNCSPPLVGTIVAIGPEQARPECFGSDNWGRAIPNSAPKGQEPVVPEDTQWYRMDDGMGNLWTIAVAAPGLIDLGVETGDQISFKHGVSFSGYYFNSGNAVVDFQGRGRVVIAVADSSLVRVEGEGAPQCTGAGPCSGYEWAMRVRINGEEIVVPPGASVDVGNSLFTNARAFTRGDDYKDASDDDPCGPKIDFVATLVTGP